MGVRAARLDRLVITLLGAATLFVTACNQTADSASAPVDAGAATADAERLKDLRREAEIAFTSAKFDRAAELFTQLIAARPDDVSNYLWRSQSYQRQGQASAAAADLDAAIRVAPNEQEPWLYRARFRQAGGQMDDALADVSRGIALAGEHTAGAYSFRASCYLARGQFAEAIADCDAAIQLEPEFAQAYNNRGLARQSLGDASGAIQDFGLAIQHHRQLSEAYNNRGALRMQLGQRQAAMADLNEAIRLDPLSPNGYDNRSRLYLEQLHDPAQAEKDCTRLIQVVERQAKERGAKASGPKTAAIYVRRAIARSQMKKASAALADCQAALAIDPQMSAARTLLRELAQETVQRQAAGPTSPPSPLPGVAAQLKTEN